VRWLAAFLALIVAWPAAAEAAGPQVPCAAPVSYPPPGQPPALQLWSEPALRSAHWSPPACLGWSGGSRLVASLAGAFVHRGPIEDLLARIGGLSHYNAIRYWSESRRAWRPLVSAAGLAGRPASPDLAAADFVAGRAYDYFEEDESGRTTYRLTILERGADRIVLQTQNLSSIRFGIVPLFESGSLQTVVFLERQQGDVWRYFQLMRAGEGAGSFALGSPKSFVNRLSALYRYVADLPPARDEAAAP